MLTNSPLFPPDDKRRTVDQGKQVGALIMNLVTSARCAVRDIEVEVRLLDCDAKACRVPLKSCLHEMYRTTSHTERPAIHATAIS